MNEKNFEALTGRCQEAWDRLDDLSDELDGVLLEISDMVEDIRDEILELRIQVGGCLKVLECGEESSLPDEK